MLDLSAYPALKRLHYVASIIAIQITCATQSFFMNKITYQFQQLIKKYSDLLKVIKEGNDTRKIVINTAWLILEKIIRLFAGLLVGILVARYLKPEQYGLYNYSLAIIIILSGFADLGLNQIVVRELVKEPHNEEEIVSTTFFLKLASGFLCVGLAFVIALMSGGDNTTLSLTLILSIRLFFKPTEAIDFAFQSKILSKYATWSRNIACLVAAFAIAAAVFTKQSILAISLLSNLEFGVSSILIFGFYMSAGQRIKFSAFSQRRVRLLLQDSWPLILSGVAIVIYMRIDQIMIKWISGDVELGIYSAAVRLTEALYLIPTAIVGSILPKITQSYNENKKSFYNDIQGLYTTISIISYTSIITVFIFASPIVSAVFGSDYTNSVAVLRVLVWAVVFVNLGIVQQSFMVVMNWTSIYMKIVFLASLMNIALNYLLIPRYGAVGATVSTVISYWFVTHGSCFFYKPLRKTGGMITKALILLK